MVFVDLDDGWVGIQGVGRIRHHDGHVLCTTDTSWKWVLGSAG